MNAVEQLFITLKLKTEAQRAELVASLLEMPDDDEDPGRPFMYATWSDGGSERSVSYTYLVSI